VQGRVLRTIVDGRTVFAARADRCPILFEHSRMGWPYLLAFCLRYLLGSIPYA